MFPKTFLLQYHNSAILIFLCVKHLMFTVIIAKLKD